MSNLEALELKDIARTDKDTGSAEAQIYFFTKKLTFLQNISKYIKKIFILEEAF